MSIKRIPKEFDGRGESKGKIFKCLIRGNNAMIYEVWDEDLKDSKTSYPYYEVFKLKILKNKWEDGKLFEMYPKSTAFGYWASCVNNIKTAYERFEKYENSRPFKIPK